MFLHHMCRSESCETRIRDSAVKVAGDDVVDEAAPVAVLFLEALFPHRFHVLVILLEELIQRSSSYVSAAVDGRVDGSFGCRDPHEAGSSAKAVPAKTPRW